MSRGYSGTIVRSRSGHESVAVQCATNEVALSGGGTCGGAGRIKSSHPSGNGWRLTCPRDNNSVYVICGVK